MTEPPLYVYRNLRTGGFSAKRRGRVVARFDQAVATEVEFRVSEAGRRRVLRDGQKGVHAYAVVRGVLIENDGEAGPRDESLIISYDPYTAGHFTFRGEPIEHASGVVFSGGHVYLVTTER